MDNLFSKMDEFTEKKLVILFNHSFFPDTCVFVGNSKSRKEQGFIREYRQQQEMSIWGESFEMEESFSKLLTVTKEKSPSIYIF